MIRIERAALFANQLPCLFDSDIRIERALIVFRDCRDNCRRKEDEEEGGREMYACDGNLIRQMLSHDVSL